MEKRILIQNIRTDGNTQSREKMNAEVVAEYAELMEGEDNVLPPIEVVQDENGIYWLVNGFHRVAAAKKNGDDMIQATIYAGTVNAAQWMAVGANKSHGLRRTNGDKAKAVQMALVLWPEQGDRALADQIGVHHRTVAKHRADLQPQVDKSATLSESIKPEAGETPPMPTGPPPKREGRDGRMYPPTQPPKDPPPPPEPPEPPAKILDKAGMEIPDELLEMWQSKEVITELVREIKRIRLFIDNIDMKTNKLWATFNVQHIVASLKNAQSSLDSEIPYAVCVYCGGDGCKACKSRGFLGRLSHKMAPSDMKATMGVE